MLWLLSRYVLGELLKTIGLAAAVLVTVIAFGATVKPLASGLLAPGDIARYVIYAIVPMLQFALPFAAGFGSTIVLHRLTNDNEVLAVAASGISYRRFLLPVFGLGILLGLVMLALVHFVIPHFWVQMQKTATKDATRLFQAAVESREAFVVGDLQIFAEDMQVIRDEEATNRTRMLLKEIAAAELDSEGNVLNDVTARYAVADLYEHEDGTYMKLTMTDVVAFDGMRLATAPQLETPRAIALLEAFRDRPKFMSLPRLLEMREHPDLFGDVIRHRFQLAQAIHRTDLWRTIEAQIDGGGVLWMVHEGADVDPVEAEIIEPSPDLRYEIRGDRFRGRTITRAGPERVTVIEYVGDDARRRIECRSAELVMAGEDVFGGVFNLLLSDCEVTDAAIAERSFAQSQLSLYGLTLPVEASEESVFDLSSSALLARARGQSGSRQIEAEAAVLEDRLLNLQWDITARIAQRNALAATSFLLLMLGSLLAMHLRNTLPLNIYLLAFLPSIGDILVISGGEQMMRDGQVTIGLAVMWLGNALLAVFALMTYLRLARN